jgi:diguanylate cyclase
VSLLAGLRERRERGVLSIELEGSRSRVQTLEQAALGMLECVQALVLDIDEIGAPELRASLTELRARLSGVGGGRDFDRLADEVEDTREKALEFAAREHEFLEVKDIELRRIIRVLGEGIAGITAGAAAYHKQILDTGTRFEAASRLSDLQKIRSAITAEVQTLRTAVAERRAADSEATAALRAEVETLRSKVETATTAAKTDALTGAANRGAFDAALVRACTAGDGFAVLLCDLDHFKSINDTYGHPVGDRILQSLVTFLRDRVRRDDLIARWGGEEFAILLPKASARAALAKAKTLVEQLASIEWTIDIAGTASTLAVTMSVGVTAYARGDEPSALVERVDKCLYAAKHGGRNRAVRG